MLKGIEAVRFAQSGAALVSVDCETGPDEDGEPGDNWQWFRFGFPWPVTISEARADDGILAVTVNRTGQPADTCEVSLPLDCEPWACQTETVAGDMVEIQLFVAAKEPTR